MPHFGGRYLTEWPVPTLTRSGRAFLFPGGAGLLYDIVCQLGHTALIAKPMTAGYPACPQCGRETRRLFTSAPVVHYAAAGFVTSDTRFERSLPPERAAKFRAQRDDAERRAKAGRLTGYERGLEGD
jgi:predicted nucleic acid-binding Zn ribbon protein